jgi:hypothetical protein
MENFKLYATIIVLIVLVYYLFNSKNTIKVYWFHRPGCTHCDNMESEWEGVERILQGSCIETKRINTGESKYASVKKNFNIDTVPQIIKIKPNGMRYKYEGKRTTDDIVAWIHEGSDDL